MERTPIMDSHIHLDPDGRPENAVRRFIEAGGTHLLIVHKPYSKEPILDIDGYERAFGTTIRMRELAERSGAVAWCVVGPYPGELPRQIDILGTDRALELQMSAVGVALDLVGSGQALGLGEVGRVHFPVSADVQGLCDRVLFRAMEGASRKNAPVVLHTESLSSNTELISHIGRICDKAGLQRERAIKHFSDPATVVLAEENGISASMLCRKDALRNILSRSIFPLLETDYIDDPSRPDVVLPPDTVPKKVLWARKVGLIGDEGHFELMVKAPMRAYGVDTMEGI